MYNIVSGSEATVGGRLSDRILEILEVSGKLVVSEYASETVTYTEDLMVLQDTMKKKEEEDFLTVEHSDNEYIFAI